MKLYKKYAKEVRKQDDLIATWKPDEQIELGDVGVIENGVFRRKSSLQERKAPDFGLRIDKTPSNWSYESAGGVNVSTSLKAGTSGLAGSVVDFKAQMEIEFTDKWAVFFQMREAYDHSISDILGLEQYITEQHDQGKWDDKWLVVTGLTQAASGIVLISDTKGAKVVFGANADVPHFKLVDAGLNVGLTYSHGMAFKMDAPAGLTPFMRLSRVQKSSFLMSAAPMGSKYGLQSVRLEDLDDDMGGLNSDS